MAELFGVATTMVRHELTDEVVVDFFDAATGVRHQQGGVMVPRGATEAEITAAVAQRCAQLEAEMTSPPSVSRPTVVALPSSMINLAVKATRESATVDPESLLLEAPAERKA